MVEAIIKWVLSNYPITFFFVGLLCAFVSLARRHGELTREAVFEALLAYYCLFAVGCFYVYNFVMHVFFGEVAARFIGWEDSPFQLEVGFASLGFGVVGLLAFRQDFSLRLAAITGPAFFLWGAAGGHIYQMIAHHNYAPGNAGAMLWVDLLFPVIGYALLFGWRKASGKSSNRRAAGMEAARG